MQVGYIHCKVEAGSPVAAAPPTSHISGVDLSKFSLDSLIMLCLHMCCLYMLSQQQVQLNCLRQPPSPTPAPVQTAGGSGFIYFSGWEQVGRHLLGRQLSRHKGAEKKKTTTAFLHEARKQRLNLTNKTGLVTDGPRSVLKWVTGTWGEHVLLIERRDHKLKLEADYCTKAIRQLHACEVHIFGSATT